MVSVAKARYEDKVLKPLEDLNLKEGEEVGIKVPGSATKRLFGIVKCWKVVLEHSVRSYCRRRKQRHNTSC